ncbi:MAG: serine hydrolase domain-containing protein [Kiritimatiellia bacterium]
MKQWNCLVGILLLGSGIAWAEGDFNALPRASSPEAEGISSRAILDYIEACERNLQYLHGFVLVRHGKIVAEGSWAPYDTLREPHMLYSHSKSFTSTAVGLLADEGKLDLDERLVDLFPEQIPAAPSANLQALRIRDLLTMNTGADITDSERKDIAGDWVKAILHNPIDHPPGTRFRYDSAATHLLAAIVEKRTGRPLMDFLAERLFKPIGIEKAWSTVSPTGVACGGWGMHMTTRELARFGLLYLREGEWNGRRILSPSWVRLATARHTASGPNRTTADSGSDWDQGYGFQFWRCRHDCYRADGAGGQFTLVMPHCDAVLSVHAGLGPMQLELNQVWQHLLPAFKDRPLPEDPKAYAALQQKLAALAIPPPPVAPDQSPVRFTGTAATNRFGIAACTLEKKADGTWLLQTGGRTLKVGINRWIRNEWVFSGSRIEPLFAAVGKWNLALSGGWNSKGEFTVTWMNLNGPQRDTFAILPDRASPPNPAQ